MKKNISIVFALILIIIFTFSGCSNYIAYTYEKLYFNCATTIVLDKNQKGKVSYNKILEMIGNELEKIDNTVSSTKESSDIYKFNRLKKDESIVIDDITKNLIELSIEYNTFTDNAFNITCSPLSDLWLLSSETYGKYDFVIPTNEDIIKTKQYVNINNIELNENTLTKRNYNEVKIDLGGIAKGYAIDQIVDILKNNGFTKGYVNVGTSSMSLLDYEKNWNLQIKSPREDSSKSLLTYNIKNKSLSTSGDYERYYIKNDKRYCHIISTETGSPIDTNIMSVTVIGGNAVFTDMITTALMTYSLNQAISFIKENLFEYDIFLTFMNNDKYELYTNVPEENFTLNNKNFETFKIFQ